MGTRWELRTMQRLEHLFVQRIPKNVVGATGASLRLSQIGVEEIWMKEDRDSKFNENSNMAFMSMLSLTRNNHRYSRFELLVSSKRLYPIVKIPLRVDEKKKNTTSFELAIGTLVVVFQGEVKSMKHLLEITIWIRRQSEENIAMLPRLKSTETEYRTDIIITFFRYQGMWWTSTGKLTSR